MQLTRRLPFVALISLAILAPSCTSTKTSTDGTAVTQPGVSTSIRTTPPATNADGQPKITFDPCKDIPASALQAENLSMPRPDRKTDGSVEEISCGFRPQPTDYRVRITASNYTLAMDRKVEGHWGFQDLTIGDRNALFFYPYPGGRTSDCVIDIEATTGVYGVLITGDYKYGPYPDCMAAARHYAEAFVQYFPA